VVKSVQNKLVVREPGTNEQVAETDHAVGEKIDDTSITAQVKYALMSNDSTSALKANVETQNGVVIMIGPYQLLMKDACAGMNSIFALSAIGMFYVYAFRWESKFRALILLATIIPITIIANFIRVVALVLITHYGGVELVDGVLHDLTGIALFIIALILVFICDGLLGLASAIARWIRPRTNGVAARRAPELECSSPAARTCSRRGLLPIAPAAVRSGDLAADPS
jgi:exosortase/archaeosortase family protein